MSNHVSVRVQSDLSEERKTDLFEKVKAMITKELGPDFKVEVRSLEWHEMKGTYESVDYLSNWRE